MRCFSREPIQEEIMKYFGLVIIAIATLTACRQVEEITGDRPIIDTKGVDMQAFESDLQDCYAYADEVQSGRKVATGAATGAAVGGVIGAVVGDSDTAKRSAGVGAVTGTMSGAGSAMSERHMVVRNCLAGRGYLVLN